MSSPEGSTVIFRYVPKTLRRRIIEKFASKLQDMVAGGRPFDTLIASDTQLRRLNRDFRGLDYPTDVLSFPSTAPPSLGDIAISFGRAREQAGLFGHTLEEELQILMLHGLLHLKGFDHESDHGQMAREEKKWRGLLSLPTGLIERVRK